MALMGTIVIVGGADVRLSDDSSFTFFAGDIKEQKDACWSLRVCRYQTLGL